MQDCTSYPVLRYQGHTYWPLSFIDNRVSLAIVAFDAAGNVVKRVDRDGTRSIASILIDASSRTVQFVGQARPAGHTITISWDDLTV